jgi:hypothetical protein
LNLYKISSHASLFINSCQLKAYAMLILRIAWTISVFTE